MQAMLFIAEYFQRRQTKPQQKKTEQEKLNCSIHNANSEVGAFAT